MFSVRYGLKKLIHRQRLKAWNLFVTNFISDAVRMLFALCFVMLNSYCGIALAGNNVWTPIGLEGLDIHVLAVDPITPSTVYAGTYDGMYISLDAGAHWRAGYGLYSFDVKSIAINPSTTSTIYAGHEFFGLFKSVDGGESWSTANTGLKDNLSYISIQSIAIDPFNPHTVYIGSDYYGIFKSTDSGANWHVLNVVSSGFPVGVNSIAIDPLHPSTLYLGNIYGIYKSIDGGVHWQDLNFTLYGFPASVSFIAIDPIHSSTLYLLSSGGIYKSIDSGINWSAIASGLPSGDESPYVRHIAINPSSPNTLYAGSDRGVYKSTDGGFHWQTLNTGLLNVDVQFIAIDPLTPSVIYAGTKSGGVYKMNLVTPGFKLTVNNLNRSYGRVLSDVSGITCGVTCTHPYTYGTVVNLKAIPQDGYMFNGWGGACSGAGNSCTVTMDAAKTVTAKFAVFNRKRNPSWKKWLLKK